eukprot:scaffold234275_cov17-Tisochrysis_lutea.AAC.1
MSKFEVSGNICGNLLPHAGHMTWSTQTAKCTRTMSMRTVCMAYAGVLWTLGFLLLYHTTGA